MTDNTLFRRSLSGAIRDNYHSYLSLFKICFLINSGLYAGMILINIILLLKQETGGDINSGMMNMAGITSIISFGISCLIMTTKSELKGQMFFPVSKLSLSLANMIMMLFGAFILVVMVAFFTFLELISGRILALIFSNFNLLCNLSTGKYLTGLVLIYFYIISSGAFIFCIFMYIRKWRIQTLTVLAVIISLPVINNNITEIYFHFFKTFILHQSIIINLMKLLLLFLMFQGLAYLPFTLREVEND